MTASEQTASASIRTRSALECVVNVSEGRRREVVAEIAAAAGSCLLDVHLDAAHHRSVLTLAGDEVEAAVRAVATAAVELLDLRDHDGAHPRLGVVDVVPFAPLPPAAERGTGDLAEALVARDRFAHFAGGELGLPCFFYGPERSLPDVRRRAFVTEAPDFGPPVPHPSAGAVCVGARDVLVAYNLWLDGGDVELARAIAAELRRRPEVRALGLDLGRAAQVSCNLVAPFEFTPEDAFDFVAARAPIARAELVGLVPELLLAQLTQDRLPELDLGPARTIERRLAGAAGGGGSPG